MRRTHSRLLLLLASCLAVAVLVPTVAQAAPVRPAAVRPDAYEPDDTTATAKPVPMNSVHTFTITGTSTPDVDWCVITVDETGTAIWFEVTAYDGWGLPFPQIHVEDDASPSGITPVMAAPVLWGGTPFLGAGGVTFLARAPKPGRYFVSVAGELGPFAGGQYTLHLETGTFIKRVSGANRFATAAAVSQRMWPSAGSELDEILANEGMHEIISPAGVILATGRDFADGLAAAAWVNMTPLPEGKMPILLTERDTLPPATAAEILRLAESRRTSNAPFTVYVVGGTAAVSAAIETQVSALNPPAGWAYPISDIVRVQGPNRFATAVAIASRESSLTSDTVFIANGRAYPDALCAAPVAGAAKAPILFVTRDAIPVDTADFLTSHPEIDHAVLVGSDVVVADSVMSALAAAPFSLDVTRVAGPDRYRTSEAVARFGVTNYGLMPVGQVLASGNGFPDAMGAAGLTAFTHTPLLLTRGTSLSSSVESFTADYPSFFPSFVVGGPSTVSPAVITRFNEIQSP